LTMEANVERAIELSTGEYIAVYHGDDVYRPEIISKEVKYLERYLDVAAVFTLGISIDINGKYLEDYSNPQEIQKLEGFSKCYSFIDIFKLVLRDYNFLICPTAMVRSNIYKNLETKWTNGKFKTSADLGVWMGILEKYPIGILPERLIYNRHSGVNRYSEKVRFMNTKRADFFLVIEHYLSKPEIYKKLSIEDVNHYSFLIFKDDVLRGLNSIISGNYPLAKELLGFKNISYTNFYVKNQNSIGYIVKWSIYCLTAKIILNTPFKKLFGRYLRKRLYKYE